HTPTRPIRSKFYVFTSFSVNFAATLTAFPPGSGSGTLLPPQDQQAHKYLKKIRLGRNNQAACDALCPSLPRSWLKYRSSVFVAVSRTSRHSAQSFRCDLIPPSTEVDNRPSKYQQIKWIVSRQLIATIPWWRPRLYPRSTRTFALHSPNVDELSLGA